MTDSARVIDLTGSDDDSVVAVVAPPRERSVPSTEPTASSSSAAAAAAAAVAGSDSSQPSAAMQLERIRQERAEQWKKRKLEEGASSQEGSAGGSKQSSSARMGSSTWQPFYLFANAQECQSPERQCIRMTDIFYQEPDGSNPITAIFVFNYIVSYNDLAEMLGPVAFNPATVSVNLFHGNKEMGNTPPSHWNVTTLFVEDKYGCHHTKAFVIFYERGVRVVIHTSNLRSPDVDAMTQGAWVQDFPPKQAGAVTPICEFERDLCGYFDCLRRLQRAPGGPGEAAVRRLEEFVTRLRGYDYNEAQVVLIPSIPGRFTMTPTPNLPATLSAVGHVKMKNALRNNVGPTSMPSTIGIQISSISGLNTKSGAKGNEFWLREVTESMRASTTYNPMMAATPSMQPPSDVHIIWPSVRTVGNAVYGYAIGSSIPLHSETVRTTDGGYKPSFQACVRKWDGSVSGKTRNAPHIKTFYRYFTAPDGKVELLWFFLGSHNLSKAAWGELEKQGQQLYIKSYELGVLFLPSKIRSTERVFSLTPSNALLGIRQPPKFASTTDPAPTTSVVAGSGPRPPPPRFLVSFDPSPRDASVVYFPVPHRIPSEPYDWTKGGMENKPWAADLHIDEPDCTGAVRQTGNRFQF